MLQYVMLKEENKRRAVGGRDYWVEGKSGKEVEALGDRRPGFVYTL